MDFKALWRLRPDVTYLNHGSYGACPRKVIEFQRSLLERLEDEPMDFLSRDHESLLNEARYRLCQFLNADARGLVFVRNATEGVNAVLRSLRFNSSDEILVTSHEYNATRNVVDYVAHESGAKVVVSEIPFPGTTKELILERIFSGISKNTRLIVFDHVTSQSAIVFPAQEICSEAASRGIPTLVDGAHAPGMIELDLAGISATYYVGNCHKWICAPKGAGFLYIHDQENRKTVRPAIISHGANDPRQDKSRFQLEFDWTGTQDYSAVFSIPAALDFLGSLYPGGIPEYMQRNHEKVVTGRRILCEALSCSEPCPESLLGAIASVPVSPGDTLSLLSRLRFEFNLEPLVLQFPLPNSRVVRISAQPYNTLDDYHALAKVMRRLEDSNVTPSS